MPDSANINTAIFPLREWLFSLSHPLGLEKTQQYYEAIAKPFEWRFTKDDLQELIRKLDARTRALRPAA